MTVLGPWRWLEYLSSHSEALVLISGLRLLRHRVSPGGRVRRLWRIFLRASCCRCVFRKRTCFGVEFSHSTSVPRGPNWASICKSRSGIERLMVRRLPCPVLGDVVACYCGCCARLTRSTGQRRLLGRGRLAVWYGCGRWLGRRYGRRFGRWYLAGLESPWFPSSPGRRRGCSRPVRVCLAGQGA